MAICTCFRSQRLTSWGQNHLGLLEDILLTTVSIFRIQKTIVKKLCLGCILTKTSFLNSSPVVYLTLKQQVLFYLNFWFRFPLEKIKSLNCRACLFSLVWRVCFDFNINEHLALKDKFESTQSLKECSSFSKIVYFTQRCTKSVVLLLKQVDCFFWRLTKPLPMARKKDVLGHVAKRT